jgi:hypothetical protein
MRNYLPAAVLALTVLSAPTAYAAKFLNFGPPAPDGSISAAIGNDSVTDANFVDVFDFIWPTAGMTSISFTTVAQSAGTNINFTSATLNGTPINLTPNGVFEVGSLIGLATGPGPQQIVISGTSGGSGSYGGNLSFMPTLVPEPASWALMISGFGGVGALLRRRRADRLPT